MQKVLTDWCNNCILIDECPFRQRFLEGRDIPEIAKNYCPEYIDINTRLSHPIAKE